MAFTSNCPKCHNQILVPDGVCADGVVRCPLCSAEYALGEIFAAAPPVLIVVHPGSTGATVPVAPAVVIAPLGEPLPAAAPPVPVPEAASEGIYAAHRVEPTLHDAEPLLFEGDEVQLVTPAYDMEPLAHAMPLGQEAMEHAAEAVEIVEFTSGPETAQEAGHPVDALAESIGEPSAVPIVEEDHDHSAEAADAVAPWGGDWGGFQDESKHEEDGAVDFAEPDQDEGLENVNFADITGKAVPGSGPAVSTDDAAVAVEPSKKKKRKREANPLIRILGIVFAGLLAVPCALLIAMYFGQKFEFLPPWLQFFNSNKPSVRAGLPRANGRPNAPLNNQTPAANADPATANPAPDGSDSGKANQTVGTDRNPGPTGEPAKEGTKPVNPSATKPAAGDNSDAKPEVKPGTAAKPDAGAKPDADPFGPVPEVAPVKEKGKPEVKPDAAAPGKPDAVKPDADPFGPRPR